MKYYSYSNQNKNYTRAISLHNVRSIAICEGAGKSVIRFSVRVDYCDGGIEHFLHLYKDEATILYKKIFEKLTKEG